MADPGGPKIAVAYDHRVPDFYPPFGLPSPNNPHHAFNPRGSIGYSVGDLQEIARREDAWRQEAARVQDHAPVSS